MGASREEFDRMRCSIPSLAAMDDGGCDRLYECFVGVEERYGAEPIDFFRYRLFEKDPEEIPSYLMHYEYAALCGKLNDPILASSIFDRVSFYRVYDDFLMRDWVVGEPDCREHFHELCEHNRKLAYKIKSGMQGRDFDIVPTYEATYLWRDALAERAIVEEVIEQHEDMAVLFPKTVSSVRLITAINDGTVTIPAAVLRCGRRRAPVGAGEGWYLFASLDMVTGTVVTCGNSHLLERFDCHPDTGVSFEGFAVPQWEELLAKATEAALTHPGLRLMNWDWACRKDGAWCLLKGKLTRGVGLCQEALGRGLKAEVHEALGLT